MSGLIVWLASLHCVLGQRSNLSESATDRLLNYPPPLPPAPLFFPPAADVFTGGYSRKGVGRRSGGWG